MNKPIEYFYTPGSRFTDEIFLLFYKDRVLVRNDTLFWDKDELFYLDVGDHHFLFVDYYQGKKCIAVTLARDYSRDLEADAISMREALMRTRAEEFPLLGLGSQLNSWYRNHQYCGICADKTVPHNEDRAMYCRRCHQDYYPRINPCVIVLVSRGAEILLARSARFKSGFYSCLAGFIEPGETPEQCVEREVREEVSIEIENIRYIKSQSWPFPSQLMLGFIADYKEGEILPDKSEIEDANWYPIDDLPNVPQASITIAGELIDYYCSEAKR